MKCKFCKDGEVIRLSELPEWDEYFPHCGECQMCGEHTCGNFEK